MKKQSLDWANLGFHIEKQTQILRLDLKKANGTLAH